MLLFPVLLKSLSVTFPLPGSAIRVPTQAGGGEQSQPVLRGPASCPLPTTDAHSRKPLNLPFWQLLQDSAEGASRSQVRVWAEKVWSCQKGWCCTPSPQCAGLHHHGSSCWDIHAPDVLSLYISGCDCSSKEWPQGDKPSPGATHATRQAMPSHQEIGILPACTCRCITHFS